MAGVARVQVRKTSLRYKMPNATVDTIVIGSSAGGVDALTRLVSLLPEDLQACVCVVMHFPETSKSILPEILARKGKLPASHAVEGEATKPGHIYVAPPGSHMLLSAIGISLSKGARENGSRPAIDPLFRSAAHARGARVLSVLLSGLLGDGTLGTSAVRRHGGFSSPRIPEYGFPCPKFDLPNAPSGRRDELRTA